MDLFTWFWNISSKCLRDFTGHRSFQIWSSSATEIENVIIRLLSRCWDRHSSTHLTLTKYWSFMQSWHLLDFVLNFQLWLSAARLQKPLKKIDKFHRLPDCKINIVFICAVQITHLNYRYTGIQCYIGDEYALKHKHFFIVLELIFLLRSLSFWW